MTEPKPTPVIARIVACLILLGCTPAGILLFLLVKLDSPGPFLFRQKRMGYRGKPFEIYKIRTMAVGSEKITALGTKNNGAYVTRIGRILRKTKIDEIPQLWNVVRGEMAFVGPRPIPIALYEELVRTLPGFEQRNSVPPGLTNLSQISLADNQLGDELLSDWQRRFEGELHGIRNKCVWYDTIILGMTALFLLRRLGLWRPGLRRTERPAPSSHSAVSA